MKLWPHIQVRWRLRLARQKVVSLKREVRTLKRLLAAETNRNREREDELVSRIATSHGVFGVQARSQPAYQTQRPAQLLVPPDLKNLSPDEREEFNLWMQDAQEHGVERGRAQQDFLNDLMHRRQPVEDMEM